MKTVNEYVIEFIDRATGEPGGAADRRFTNKKEAEKYIKKQNSNVYNMYSARFKK